MEAPVAEALSRRLGVQPTHPALFEQACVHSSFSAESGLASNQRLEFLGDAILDLVVAEHLFATHPELDEGGLSKVRIAVVNETVLAEVARELNLGELLVVGRGADAEGLRFKPSVLSDAFEAVLGATYLSCGHDEVSRVILDLLGSRLEAAALAPGSEDYKSLMNEWAQAEHATMPVYEVEGSGPAHDRRYIATVSVNDAVLGSGEGRSKKASEMEAAKAAWGVVGHA